MPSAPDPRRPGAACRWLLAGLVAAATACSGGPRPPATPPPRTESPPEASKASAPPPPAPSAPPGVTEPRPPAPKVVIEPTEPEPGEPLTLAEAADRERRRRLRAGEPIAVINDANLEEHAVGQLTFMEDEPAEAEAAGGSEAAEDPEEGPDEQYWRQRVLYIRQRLADAAMEVPALEDKAAELRRRFYETDDAYYRDTRIKPAWDRAIDQTAQARATVDALRDELAAALEEGRLAGALPGWLREGIDLVPPEPEPEPETYEPGEPVIVGEDGGGGR